MFVTGHTGFKGSWLVQLLHSQAVRITGYSLPPPTTPSLFAAANLVELVDTHIEADIRDGARLEAAIAAAHPDVVMHLAAQPLVRRSYRDPVETFSSNVVGTATLLDAVRRAGRPCVVLVITSDKCYEPHPQGLPHEEDDRLGGHDPYSASKAAAELVTASFRASYFPPGRLGDHGVQVASVRAGNVIGGGDWADDRIITDLVRHLAAGRPVPVRNPDSVRPWQHVLEPLAGYLALATAMLSSPAARWCTGWNFGPSAEDDVTVRELVEAFIAAWGDGSWVDVHDPRSPAETPALRLAIAKAQESLPWYPRWTAATAVSRAALWYRSFQSDQSTARRLCQDDIAAYSTLLRGTGRLPGTAP